MAYKKLNVELLTVTNSLITLFNIYLLIGIPGFENTDFITYLTFLYLRMLANVLKYFVTWLFEMKAIANCCLQSLGFHLGI